MANRMADKKKNASQSRIVAPAPTARSGEKEQGKNVKAVARERGERKEHERKQVDRFRNFRTNRLVRFILDAYHELRYKVTWPTFEEARNMTFVVILISAAVGALLGIADIGLFQLFRLITGQ